MQVHTTLSGESVHKHQLVTRTRDDMDEDLVVVGIEDNAIYVQDTDFEFGREHVDAEKWEEQNFRGQTAGDGSPVFAY